jgi:hypothetical protein
MLELGNNEGRILHFQKFKEIEHGDSHIELHKGSLGAGVFIDLYLRTATCSLVWRGTQQEEGEGVQEDEKGLFDPTLPFEFFDTQFSKKPHSRVKNIRRPAGPSGSLMLHIPYNFTKHRVTLFLADEERLVEYDLALESEKYKAEVADSARARANVTFARFDAEVKYQGQREDLKGHRVSYSLTFERLGDPPSDVWEFSIRLPRDLKLEFEEATLKWIARHHEMKEMLRVINFRMSLDELSRILKPRTDQISV